MNRLSIHVNYTNTRRLILWGVSIVIIGLVFKLLSWKAGEIIIISGLILEAFLFFLLGFVKDVPHHEQSGTMDSVTFHHYLQMEQEATNCKHQLATLSENLWKINQVLNGINKAVEKIPKNKS